MSHNLEKAAPGRQSPIGITKFAKEPVLKRLMTEVVQTKVVDLSNGSCALPQESGKINKVGLAAMIRALPQEEIEFAGRLNKEQAG